MKEETLSDFIVKGGCIEDCACNSGDKDYNPDLKEYETHYFINADKVREFIKNDVLKEIQNKLDYGKEAFARYELLELIQLITNKAGSKLAGEAFK